MVEAELGDLRAQVADRQWYHTLELAPGVVTPGWFDTRPLVAELPLPASLDGARCLDVGTFDGFWAFELERRGAREVVAIDVTDAHEWDWPAGSSPEAIAALSERKRGGDGFALARRALGSGVEFRERSVYDLDPEEVGRFDFVFMGSLLLHLRDPVGALERVRSVCSGRVLVVETIDGLLSAVFRRRPLATLDGEGRPWWWQANAAAVVRMVEAAGFSVLGSPGRVRIRRGHGQPVPRPRPGSLRDRRVRRELWAALRGDPHVVILAAPR
jgi:tRNA (mo5U34)-methyltransferase